MNKVKKLERDIEHWKNGRETVLFFKNNHEKELKHWNDCLEEYDKTIMKKEKELEEIKTIQK